MWVLPGPPRIPPRTGISCLDTKSPPFAGIACTICVSAETNVGREPIFGDLSLAAKSPFPAAERSSGRAVTERGYSYNPSTSSWRDHSTGRSRRRVTPILYGSRPSIAAWTRLGARKASELETPLLVRPKPKMPWIAERRGHVSALPNLPN